MTTIRIPPLSRRSNTTSQSSNPTSSSSAPSRDSQVIHEDFEQDLNDKSKRAIAGTNRMLNSIVKQGNAEEHERVYTPYAAFAAPSTNFSSMQTNSAAQPLHFQATASSGHVFTANSSVQNQNDDVAMDVDTSDVIMEDVSQS